MLILDMETGGDHSKILRKLVNHQKSVTTEFEKPQVDTASLGSLGKRARDLSAQLRDETPKLNGDHAVLSKVAESKSQASEQDLYDGIKDFMEHLQEMPKKSYATRGILWAAKEKHEPFVDKRISNENPEAAQERAKVFFEAAKEYQSIKESIGEASDRKARLSLRKQHGGRLRDLKKVLLVAILGGSQAEINKAKAGDAKEVLDGWKLTNQKPLL